LGMITGTDIQDIGHDPWY